MARLGVQGLGLDDARRTLGELHLTVGEDSEAELKARILDALGLEAAAPGADAGAGPPPPASPPRRPVPGGNTGLPGM